MFERIKANLTDRFGGVTAFLRSPADGACKSSTGEVHDQGLYELRGLEENLVMRWN